MGNTNIGFHKSCCRNICRNDKEVVDNYLRMNMDIESLKKVIKIQSHYRSFRVRNKILKTRLLKCSKFQEYSGKLNLNLGENASRNYCESSPYIQQIESWKTKSSRRGTTTYGITPNPDQGFTNVFDYSQIDGMIVDKYSEISPHPKVLEIEKKLGSFKINEKESCIIRLSNLYEIAVYYKNNTFYKGYLNKDYLKEGHGVLYLPDGSKYEGFFKNDMMNGRGRLINVTNKFHYEGNFLNNKANGFGRYVTFDGSIYVGYWQDDKQHGLGEEVFPDGSRYEGNFENGKKQGKGIFIFKDGSKYEGEFKANLLCGFGSYAWSDGKIYHGTWVDNKMDGKGIFIWTDKKKYIGEYYHDKKHGYGIFIWPDDKKYEGMWENGKQHGYGKITQSSISQIGEWANGKILSIIKDNDEKYNEVLKFLDMKKQQSKIYEDSKRKV